MRIGLSVAAMLLAASNMQGQTMLDSLLGALDGQRGADRVRTLGEIEWELSFTDPAKAVRYGEEALKLAESLRDSALAAQAANDLAIPEYRLGHFPRCLALNNRSLSIRRSLADTMGIAASHAKLGTVFTELLDLDSALHHNQAAERIYAQRGDMERLATMRGNQARLYQQMGDLAMAEKVARSTVDLILPTGNDYVIANTYGQLAQILIDRKDSEGSEDAAEKALPIFQRIDDRAGVASISNVLGICARIRGDNTAAMEHYMRALSMAADVGDQEGEATYQSNVANVLRDMGRLDEACTRYDSAIALCRAGGFTDQHLSALLGYVDALERMGNWTKALTLQKEYQARKDSVYDRERIDALSDMQVKYETERTEKELAQERERTLAQEARIGRQRSWIGFITGGVLIAALLTWLLLAKQRARARAEGDRAVIAEREQGSKTMLERTDAERKRIASELHDGVGQHLTGLKYRLEDIASRVSAAAPAEAERMKDVLALVRWSQNLRGRVSGFRTLQLLPGIGPKTAVRLNAAGLAHIGQIAATPVDLLALLLGNQASVMRQFANGIDERPLIPASQPQKSFIQQETATSRLAKVSGAAVVPCFYYRRADGSGYDIEVGPALEHFPSGEMVEDATRINRLIEGAVRRVPEQYFWQHRRFKSRPPGEPPIYRR